MEWISRDTSIVLENFTEHFLSIPVRLELAIDAVNEVRAYVVSDQAGENESVLGKWHYNPRMQGQQFRQHHGRS